MYWNNKGIFVIAMMASLVAASVTSCKPPRQSGKKETNATNISNSCEESLRNGKLELALNNCTNAIESKPNDADAYIKRGAAYAQKEDYDLAIKDYTKAIQLAPDSAEAYYRRSVAYTEIKQYDLAINDSTKAIELKHDYSEAYMSRASARSLDRDIALADNDIVKAEELNRKSPDNAIMKCKATIEDPRGNQSLTLDYCNQAVKLNPNNAEALRLRGSANLANIMKIALKAQMNGTSIRDNDENIVKSLSLALSDFNKWIELDRSNPNAYYKRGMIYEIKGEYELATKDYNKSIGLDPNGETGLRVKKHLGKPLHKGVLDFFQNSDGF